MLRQTPSAIKVLTRAYRAVLREMHLKSHRAAMAAGLAASGLTLTPSARACVDCGDPDHDPFVDVSSMFNIGSYFVGPAPVDSVSAVAEPMTLAATSPGVFAGAAQRDTRLGTQRGLIIYVHDLGTADIDTRIWSGTTTMRQYANGIADDQRRWLAANSGGKMDMNYTVIDGAIGMNPATGEKWAGGLYTVDHLIAQAGLVKSDYAYVQLIWDHMGASQYVSNPGGGVIGLGTGGNGSGTQVNWSTNFSRRHELGHNLGFGHTGDYNSAGGGWTYNFTTKQYVASSAGSPGRTANLVPLSIGVDKVEYGNPVDVMGNQTNFSHYNPRAKLAAGWLKQSNFKNLVTLAPDQASALPLYAHQALQVVSRGSGDTLEYGVAQGYGDGAYAGTFSRRAQRFVANADKTGGDWQYYIQNVDLYCTRTDNGAATPTYGIEFRVDGVYIGVMQAGQVIKEKDIANFLYQVDSGKNLVTDLNAAAPDNPDRYRSTKYTLNFTGMATDATGPYTNLIITPNIGVIAAGLRIDADSATAGAQNGDAAWSAGAGNWHNIDTATNNVVWTDGSRAVIGGGTGRAGTITISGTVVAKGITFDNGNLGLHTLTGGTLALGAEGLVAVNDAMIQSELRYDADQFWDVARGRTIHVLGAVTTNANDFALVGGGSVSFYAANALSAAVAVHEGTLTQYADQSPTSLSIGQTAAYTVAGGSLILTAGKNISGAGVLNLSTTDSSNAAPALWLGQGISSGANPARSPVVSTDLTLTTGLQVIRASTGRVSYYDALGGGGTFPDYMYALISGDISGAGGLAYYGDHGTAELVLTGTNTFTGGIELRRGMLTPIGVGAIPYASRLTFNTAAGDTARFYLRGVDRTISDLSSTGAGTALIANSTGAKSYITSRSTPDAATLHILQNTDATYAGIITDTNNAAGAPSGYGPSGSAGALSINKLGAATLTLAGTGTYTGATTVTAGTLRVGSAAALPSATALTVASGATLDLAGFNTTVGSLAGAGSVTLGAATLTAGGNNADTAFSGALTGTGGLTKNGSDKLTLSGQNTYTGSTRVNAGTLALDFASGASPADLVNAASVLRLAGGTLEISGRTGATLNQNFASTELLAGNSGIRLVQNGAASLDVNIGAITRTAGTIDFSGITGATVGARILTSTGTAGGLLDGGASWATVNGGDWATKDATNTYVVAFSNYTDVSTVGTLPHTAAADIRIVEGGAGTVALAAPTTAVNSILMRAESSAGVIDTAGKTLETSAIAVARTAKTLTVGTAAGDGTLTSGTGALLLLNNLAAADGALTVNAALADRGATPLALTASGGASAGTIVLGAANTYTGGTTLTNAVTLRLDSSGTLGSGAVALSAGTVLMVNRADTFTLANALTGAGQLVQGGTGTTVLSGANTFSGGTTVSAGALRLDAAGTLGTGAVALSSGTSLELANTASTTLANAFTGAGSILKSGAGTVTLTGSNALTGGLTLRQGTLVVSTPGQLGAAGAAISVETGATLNFATASNQTLTRTISGTGTWSKSGGSALIVQGTQLFSGTIAVQAGDFILDSLGADDGRAAVNLTGGRFLLSSPFVGGVAEIGNLTGTGGSVTTAYNSTAGTRTLGVTQTTAGTFAGSLADASGGRLLGLQKSGAATLTLSGNNSYTGGTTVNAGTLLAGHNNAFGTGAVTVNSGGTLNAGLAGSGRTLANAITVNDGGRLMGATTFTGAIAINAGGTLAPGNSPGIETFSGGLTFAAGSAYEWEFLGNSPSAAGTDFDRIVLTSGTMTVADGALFKVTGLGVDYANAFWTSDRSFLVVDAQGPATIAGTFTTDTAAAGAFAGRGSWTLNTANGDLYAVWTAVPEPSTYGLLGAGAFAAMALVRRRRRNLGMV